MDDMVEKRIERRQVKRAATEAEVAAAGHEIVRWMRDADEVAAERKEANERFKQRAEAVQLEVDRCRRAIEDGTTSEDHECEVIYDAKEARVTARRISDGAVLEDRAMTAEELDARRQLNLAPAPVPDNVEEMKPGKRSKRRETKGADGEDEHDPAPPEA